METLLDLFATFAGHGEKTALVYRSGVRRRTCSYRELHDLALRMNGWLARQGVGEGDRVVIWAPNSPWWVAAFWGVMARGGVAVPVDFMSGRDRAETIAALAEARLVIQSRDKPERLVGYPSILVEELPHLLEDILPEAAGPPPSPATTAQLIYTSGTTGNPKGVILTHGNLMANLRQVNDFLPIVTEQFFFLSLLPLSHMFEQMGGLFTPLAHGSAIVYLRTLKPAAIMEALGEEDIFAVVAVPRLLQLLQNSITRELASKGMEGLFAALQGVAGRHGQPFRKRLFWPIHRKFGRHFTMFVSGGAPLDPDTFRFWQNTGFTVIEGYGLTECAPVLTANTLERQVAGSVGRALPGVELKLEGNEILVRGENVFPGYYRNEAATREAFTPDGWFRTGDLGEVDAEGFLHIKGRQKEVIVTGSGINVYPDELEALLNRAPGVREGCVVGVDRGGGEEVHAVLILDGSGRDPEEIVREVNDRLDPLHRITGYSLWPDAEFPKTTTLKVRKFMVRSRLAAQEAGEGAPVAVDRLAAIIAQVTGASPGDVGEGAFLVANLGLTSIGRLELVNYLEQEFRLDLDDDLIGPQTRVADLRTIVESRARLAAGDRYRLWQNGRLGRFLRRMFDLLVHAPLLFCFVRLRHERDGHLSGLSGPVLFAANHVSYLDQPVIMFSLPSAIRYRTATAVWAEFFFQNFRNLAQRLWKRFAYEYGTVALNLFPLPQSRGFRGSLRHMGRLVDRGINLLVFPEGERTQTDRMLPFQLGLGLMVDELDIPVVPVRIRGLERVFPRGAIFPRRGEVTVTFGEPLSFRGEGPAEVVASVRRAIERL